MAFPICETLVIVVILLFAATTYWAYTVPKEYKERNRRWKQMFKG